MSLPVVEMFYSIQGEGQKSGTPTVFLRLGGCNLRCQGFGVNGCDSNYSVIKNNSWRYFDSADMLIKEINALNAPESADLVVTGGEPTLHLNNEVLIKTLHYFKNRNLSFETNATINIDFGKNEFLKEALFAMSVKLSNSGEANGVNFDAIANIVSNARCFFKFVVKDAQDELEIKKLASHFPKVQIYCMPLGANIAELEKNATVVFEMCKNNGWNYSDRLHIRLFNDKKGV